MGKARTPAPFALRVQRLITGGPSGLPLKLAAIAALVVAPTLVRAAVTPLIGRELPFVTYFPTVMVATLWLGWRGGLVTLILSGLTANFLFAGPALRLSGGPGGLFSVSAFVISGGSIVALAGAFRGAVLRLEGARSVERALNAELQHRVKNTLAIVQAMASQTLRFSAEDPREFYKLFQNRLQALARAHDLLSSGSWRECRLPELAIEALEPFQAGPRDRLTIEGPPAILPAACCVPLVLALHELATNAVKYGALSTQAGRVRLSWAAAPESRERLALQWRETGGPPVEAPKRRGLGSHLLTRQPGLDRVELRFAPEGVDCEIEVRRLD